MVTQIPKCIMCGTELKTASIFIESVNHIFAPNICNKCSDDRIKSKRIKDEDRHIESLWNSLCPPLYRNTDQSLLPKRAFNEAMSWQFGATGLLLHGATGLGKTRVAFELVRRLVLKDKLKVVVFHANSFAHLCASRFSNQTGEEWIASVARAQVVFFDDLGKFKLTERVEAELLGLVESRTANMLPMIATTNFVGDQLAQKMSEDRGAPLVRRIRQFCKAVAF